MTGLIDLIGKRFGRLTVQKRVENNKHRQAQWLCSCACGNDVVVISQSLRSGATKSCGCLSRELSRERLLLPEGIAAFNMTVCRMKRDAKKRCLEWRLTDEQVRHMTKQHCFYCGTKPSQVTSGERYNGVYIYNGLDRIDNVKGYTIDNVVPCCKVCNGAKSTLVASEFDLWIERVYKCLIIRKGIGEIA